MAATEHVEQQQVALVTGGSDGIGKAIARALAARGVRVVIVGRSPEKTRRAAEEIGSALADAIVADLVLVAEVRRVAAEVLERCDRLDMLVLSAGVLSQTRHVTAEGLEASLAVNYLSRFLLTSLLLDRLSASHARVVSVAAAGNKATVHFDDPCFEKTPYSVFPAVGQAQQLNDAFIIEAHHRWGARGVAFHVTLPGVVDTAGGRDLTGGLAFVWTYLLWPFKSSPDRVATWHVRLLLEKAGADGGKMHRMGSSFAMPAPLLDDAYRARCWELSEALVERASRPAPA